MDLHDLIRTRRTVHVYEPGRDLPAGALDRALEAAHWAPNHRFTYPWRFTIVGPETRAKVAEVAVRLKCAKKELSEEGCAKARAKVLDPSAMIVLRQALHEEARTREEDYASLACATQNLMLSFASEGIGSKWTTGGVTRDEEVYALLGIDPEVERIVGFLWVGYALKQPSPPPRPAWEDHVERLP
ncbi:MAG: nitroreductase [Planctomycetes bacterium]|nr:nitroreductase [Planctomycetota bacterium]